MALPITFADVADLLKTHYEGPIRDQLNKEVLVLDMFKKSKRAWNGMFVEIPFKTGRNTAVWGGPASKLLDAGKPTFIKYKLGAKRMYGRVYIDGDALAYLENGEGASFINELGVTLDDLTEGIGIKANQWCFDGGRVLGWVHERKFVAAGAATDWEFNGNLDRVSALLAACAGGAPGVNPVVQLVRTDTRLPIVPGAGLVGIQITGVVATGHKITLQVTDATSTIDTTFATLGQAEGTMYAVELIPHGHAFGGAAVTGHTISELAGPGIAAGQGFPADTDIVIDTVGATFYQGVKDYEWDGMYSYLSGSKWPGSENTGIAMSAQPLLRGHIGMNATGNLDASYTWTNLNLDRMQEMFDVVNESTGVDGDCDTILCHPRLRSAYVAAVRGAGGGANLFMTVGNKPAAVDASVDPGKISYIAPIKSSQHCGKGIFIFVSSKTWALYERQAGKFEDMDGSQWSRDADADAFKAYYRWRCNIGCDRPAANAVLGGVRFPGMGL